MKKVFISIKNEIKGYLHVYFSYCLSSHPIQSFRNQMEVLCITPKT